MLATPVTGKEIGPLYQLACRIWPWKFPLWPYDILVNGRASYQQQKQYMMVRLNGITVTVVGGQLPLLLECKPYPFPKACILMISRALPVAVAMKTRIVVSSNLSYERSHIPPANGRQKAAFVVSCFSACLDLLLGVNCHHEV